MEDITDIDYKHAKRVFREFKINNLNDYHDLYVKILEMNVLKYMSLIQSIFSHYLD